MTLEEKHQSQLMHLIEDILQKTTNANKTTNETNIDAETIKKLLEKMDEIENENLGLLKKLQESQAEKEELMDRCRELNDTIMINQDLIKKVRSDNENFYKKVIYK